MSLDARMVVDLVEAALDANFTQVKRVANAAVRQMASDGDLENATRLRAMLRRKSAPLRASGHIEHLPVDQKSRLPLIEEQDPPSTPIFLDQRSGSMVRDFIWDAEHAGILEEKGIAGRLNLLLSGPPGTGKTSLAGHIAASLNKPLYVVRLDSLVSSLLGDTSKNVRMLFDYFNKKGGILFLDEMDAVAKLRDDRQELGELKRVVNTVLQGLDSADDRSIVIGATNHPQLLDPAIWRRFPYRLEIPLPDRDVRAQMWDYFLFLEKNPDTAGILAEISGGLSGADIQAQAYAARRHAAISGSDSVDLSAVAAALAESSPGDAHLPPRSGVQADQHKRLALELAAKGLNAPKIGALLGFSRQWALKLLKDGDDK